MKTACAQVLANVPHSDEMTDDPFKYIASQVQIRSETSPPVSHPPRTFSTLPPPIPKSHTQPILPTNREDTRVSTSTSSATSTRDIADKTDYSTPLTSAGITPGETGRRFSDAIRHISTTKLVNNQKNATTRPKSRSTIKSSDPRKPSTETDSNIRPTLKLVQDSPPSTSGNDLRNLTSFDSTRPIRHSQLDLNKSLPPPPPTEAPPPPPSIPTIIPEDEVRPTRRNLFLKSFRRDKSQPASSSRNHTTTSPESSVPMAPVYPDLSALPILPTDLHHHQPKPRFRLKLFNRRQQPVDVVVS